MNLINKNRVLGCMLLVGVIVLSSFTTTNLFGTLQYYKGTIGNVEKVQLSLELTDDNTLKGSMIEEEAGDVFVLSGRLNEAIQSMSINVANSKNVTVGRIQARYYTNDLDEVESIKGSYADLATSTIKPLNLEKIAEFVKNEYMRNSDLH